jgi:hypothetical protein
LAVINHQMAPPSHEIMLKAKSKAGSRRITAGAYDTADHVANLGAISATPHVTQNRAVTKTGKTRKQGKPAPYNCNYDYRMKRHNKIAGAGSRAALRQRWFSDGLSAPLGPCLFARTVAVLATHTNSDPGVYPPTAGHFEPGAPKSPANPEGT